MLISFLNLYLICRALKVRNALIFALCMLSVFVFGITEFLSFFKILTSKNVQLFWGGTAFLSSCATFFLYRKKIIEWNYKFKKEDIFKVFFLLWIILLGAMAVLTVPNNADSMIYHLSRIDHWIANASVSYYQTNIPQQIYSPVLAEYFILQTFLLFKTDILANLVQFFSYVLSACFIFQIADRLNYSKLVKYFITLLFLTIPMAIAQSITTQNDLVSTVWLLAFVLVCLDLLKLKSLSLNRENMILFIEFSLIVAFAFLTKSHVCLSMLFFFAVVVIHFIKQRVCLKNLFFYGVISFVILGSFLVPTFYRNYVSTGNILAMVYMGKISVEMLDISYLFVNFLKNLALIFSNPIFPEIFPRFVIDFSENLGVPIDHPSISFTHNFLKEILHISIIFDHDHVSASYLSLLWLVSLCVFVFLMIFKFSRLNNKLFMLVLNLSIFVMMIILRYQEWGCRLLLPYMALMVIFIGYVISSISVIENKKIYILVVYLGVFACFPAFMTLNYQISFIDRGNKVEKYFASIPMFYQPYYKVSQMINLLNIKMVGLYSENDVLEYALTKMLPNKKFKHISVTNGDMNKDFLPDAIIAINKNIQKGQELVYQNVKYRAVYFYQDLGSLVVLLSEKVSPLIFYNLTEITSDSNLVYSDFQQEEHVGFVNQSAHPSFIIKTDYLKNLFDLKKGISVHLVADLLGKKEPLTLSFFQNNKLLLKMELKKSGLFKVDMLPILETENEFILRIEMKKDKFQHVAFKSLIITQTK